MSPLEISEAREQIVILNRRMIASGLSHGTSGNLSVRVEDGMLITPTGVAADAMTPEHVVPLTLEGKTSADSLRPSSEWEMHARIYQHRADARAIVHCHSPYATMLACTRRSIPPVHYMIAVTEAQEIRCSEYATPTTPELADAALVAIQDSLACLLANHGQIAIGHSLEHALRVAAEVEALARTYWGCLAIGGSAPLTDTQMDDVLEVFAHYGQQSKSG